MYKTTEEQLQDLQYAYDTLDRKYRDLKDDYDKVTKELSNAELKIKTELVPRIKQEERSYDNWALSPSRASGFDDCSMNCSECSEFECDGHREYWEDKGVNVDYAHDELENFDWEMHKYKVFMANDTIKEFEKSINERSFYDEIPIDLLFKQVDISEINLYDYFFVYDDENDKMKILIMNNEDAKVIYKNVKVYIISDLYNSYLDIL